MPHLKSIALILALCFALPRWASADLEVLSWRFPQKLPEGQCVSGDMLQRTDPQGRTYNTMDYYNDTQRKRMTWERNVQEMELTATDSTITIRCLMEERVCTEIDKKKVLEVFGQLAQGALKGKTAPANPPFKPTGEKETVAGLETTAHMQKLSNSERKFFASPSATVAPLAKFAKVQSELLLGAGGKTAEALEAVPALKEELTLANHFDPYGAIVKRMTRAEGCSEWRVIEQLVAIRTTRHPQSAYEFPKGFERISPTDYTRRVKEAVQKLAERIDAAAPDDKPNPGK